jgi:hypothetical protein
VARRDPLARFFTWPLSVERRVGQTGRGVLFAEPVQIMAKIRMTAEVVTADDGSTVTSSAACQMSADTEPIPTGSRVTLPVELDPSRRPVEVIVAELHDTRVPGIPRFYEVKLGGGA